MSTKKTETSAAVEEKKSKTDIETRMEAGKVEVMKVVGGIPGAEKLAELIERGKKKGNLSAAELMDVLEGAGIPVAYFDVQGFDDYLNMLEICNHAHGRARDYTVYGLERAERDKRRRVSRGRQ